MFLLLLQGATTVVTTPGPSGLSPLVPGDATVIITTSAVSVWLIQQLKKSKWFALLTPSSTTMNRLASIVGALLSATGIHLAFNAGTLTITGLTLATAVPALIAWFKSFVMNELIYMGVQTKQQAVATGQTVGAPATPAPSPTIGGSDK